MHFVIKLLNCIIGMKLRFVFNFLFVVFVIFCVIVLTPEAHETLISWPL